MSDAGIKVCQNCHSEKTLDQFPLCRKWHSNICKKIAYDKLKSNPELYKKKCEANKRQYAKNPIPQQFVGYKWKLGFIWYQLLN